MVAEEKIVETREWLTKAHQDLLSANWLLSSPDALYQSWDFTHSKPLKKPLKDILRGTKYLLKRLIPLSLW